MKKINLVSLREDLTPYCKENNQEEALKSFYKCLMPDEAFELIDFGSIREFADCGLYTDNIKPEYLKVLDDFCSANDINEDFLLKY